MRVVRRGDRDYDRAREISNSRFDLKPDLLCYCDSAADVAEALALARGEGLPIRIRSGGHHHEGMCSADGALVIDLSGISHVDFSGEPASIGPGAKLEAVYAAAEAAGKLFSGGGCGDVRVGGLVQGGGWGPYSRHLGLTCDRLVGFEIVTAEGAVANVSVESDPDLLRAVRGGGGGNFGVVTDFRFAPAPRPETVLSFSMAWDDPNLVAAVTDEWRRHFPGDEDDRLTTFCRLTAMGRHREDDDRPVLVGGSFLGARGELEALLRRLLPKTFEHGQLGVSGSLRDLTPLYQPGPPVAALRRRLTGIAAQDLRDTCAGVPHRHKVSSTFPRSTFGEEAVERLVTFIAEPPPEAEGRFYLSLHCLGGAVAAQDGAASSFAFRDKPFMLQYQSWWVDDPGLDDRCIRWVRDFREAMADDTEFAFINFPDRDLASDRRELLYQYYADKLDDLIAVKRRVDPHDVFRFGMSIPTS